MAVEIISLSHEMMMPPGQDRVSKFVICKQFR